MRLMLLYLRNKVIIIRRIDRGGRVIDQSKKLKSSLLVDQATRCHYRPRENYRLIEFERM